MLLLSDKSFIIAHLGTISKMWEHTNHIFRKSQFWNESGFLMDRVRRLWMKSFTILLAITFVENESPQTHGWWWWQLSCLNFPDTIFSSLFSDLLTNFLHQKNANRFTPTKGFDSGSEENYSQITLFPVGGLHSSRWRYHRRAIYFFSHV